MALCILLRRLAYPSRLKDLQLLFNLSPQSLSQIINYMVAFISENHAHHLTNLRNVQWLNEDRMEMYAEAVRTRGGAVQNCWGFIDGTTRAICRPSTNQEQYYSGHKRQHCLKYQSIMCPDGIIINLKGAYIGRRHDAGIFRESNMYNELEAVATFGDRNYVLYGDQAYPISNFLLCPYPNRQGLLSHQQALNNSMKVIRTAVEWGFQKVVTQFVFLDLKKKPKTLIIRFGKYVQ
uniref:Uncharacterized protein LOC114344382 n=1 Tax=Diabrotica virgifera virgifera TaxID=50390 RepID=A0A6P7H4T8_DIAVI